METHEHWSRYQKANPTWDSCQGKKFATKGYRLSLERLYMKVGLGQYKYRTPTIKKRFSQITTQIVGLRISYRRNEIPTASFYFLSGSRA